MAVIHANNISTTLNGAITSGQTSIVVTDATGMPSPTGGDYFTLTLDDQMGVEEIIHVTARTGTTLTVIRAREGTSDLNWPDLSVIENRLTAATIDSKITELADDPSPTAAGNLDLNSNEILNGARVRADILSKASDTTNNITFTTSTITLKPFNADVANFKSNGMQLGGANARVTTIYDSDTLAEDSNTALATQQSIKAYVDSFKPQMAKAWGTYDQSTGMVVLDSFNVASISDDGIGVATITFSTPMANANYVVVAMGTDLPGGDKPGPVVYTDGVTPTVNSFSLTSARGGGDTRDMPRVSFVVFGDQ